MKEIINTALQTDLTIEEIQGRLKAAECLQACVHQLLETDDLDYSINVILRKILAYYEAERAYVFAFDWDSGVSSNTHEVCAEGVKPEIENLQQVPLKLMSFWVGQFQAREYIVIEEVAALPVEREEEKYILEAQGINSLLAAPSFENKQLVGFIGVDNPKVQKNDWKFLSELVYFVRREKMKYAVQQHELKLREVLEAQKEKNEAIYNTVSNSIIATYCTEGYPLYSINDFALKSWGYDSMEDYLAYTGGMYETTIHPADRQVVIEQLKNPKMDDLGIFVAVYRMRKKDGSYIWVKDSMRKYYTKEGDAVYICSVLDISDNRDLQTQIELYRSSDLGGVFKVSLEHNYEVLYANDFLLSLYECEEVDLLHKNVLQYVYPEDLERVKLILRTAQNKGDSDNISWQMRIVTKNQTVKYVVCNGKVLKENGAWIVAGYIADFTEAKKTEKMLEALIAQTPGGIVIFELSQHDITFTFISKGIDATLGYAVGETLIVMQKDKWSILHTGDRVQMVAALKRAYEQKSMINIVCRVWKKEHRDYVWLNFLANYIEDNQGVYLYYATFVDVTPVKKAEMALLENGKQYEIALNATNLSTWRYEITKNRFTGTQKSGRNLGTLLPDCIENSYEAFLEWGLILPESYEAYRELHQKIAGGAASATTIVRFDLKKTAYEYQKITYTTVFDQKGKPSFAVGVGENVDELIKQEQRFNEELTYRQDMPNGILASYRINLTEELIEEQRVGQVVTKKLPYDAEFRQRLTNLILDPVQAQDEYAAIAVGRLLHKFYTGKTKWEADYVVRYPEDAIKWVHRRMQLIKRPATGDIIAFVYLEDVTETKIFAEMINGLAKQDYDYLAYINIKKDEYVVSLPKTASLLPGELKGCYSKNIMVYPPEVLAGEDIERLRQAMALVTIIQELATKEVYTVGFAMHEKDGKMHQKQVRFSYIHRQMGLVLVTRIDTTNIIKKEQEANEKLAKALTIVEEANLAKSIFLARMSHEIRTPMNAIIGLAQIAKDNLADSEFVLDCINKSNQASMYLLNLINDILDMSKIDSGEIKLTKARLGCQDIQAVVKTIALSQAVKAGVDFTLNVVDSCREEYLGDRVRIQQILVNLIANAIKFTPRGGKVLVELSEAGRTATHVRRKFKITDTGIGISEEFMEQLFKPFVQEYTSSTSKYGGTGLGLSIVKRLVELMDGTISVQSVKGKGTCFEVEIPLEIATEALTSMTEQKDGFVPQAANLVPAELAGRRILLCEDQPLNILIATKLLERKGMAVTSATTGREGVAAFCEYPRGYFDAILMDIRMPEMDGLEAAKTIRSLQLSDAPVIPIIAMTANAYEEDIDKSIEAGMNAHLAKPVEAAKLYATLANCIAQRELGEET